MKHLPVVPVGLDDPKLTQFLTNVLKALQNQPDVRCYTMTVIWRVPFDLPVPTGQPVPRNSPPISVKLTRAILTNQPDTVLDWGGNTWNWRGNDLVRITNQAGLVENVKYDLTFEVVG